MDDLKIETVAGKSEGVRILRVSGPLTLKTLSEFQRALQNEAAAVTIVDLSAVPYLDSAALGSLMGLHFSCQQKDRRYALAGVPKRIQNIFQVTHVDKILLSFPTVEDAEKSLESSGSRG